MKKRILSAVAVCIILAAALCACTGNSGTTGDTSQSSTAVMGAESVNNNGSVSDSDGFIGNEDPSSSAAAAPTTPSTQSASQAGREGIDSFF